MHNEAFPSGEENRKLLQAIIDSLSDAVSVVDEHGKGIMINRAYVQITGMTGEQIINKPATVDIAEGDSVHMQVLKTGKPIKDVRMKVGQFGKEVIVSCAPIIINGKLKGSVGVIHDISEIRRVMDELERTRHMVRVLESRYTFEDIIGESALLKNTIERARQAANTPVSVLLRGECGTGKELFAHAIHHSSPRAQRSFIRVNCAALTDTLLESELFGYAEGAFTGAKKGGHKGYFESANRGTLFLDEIGAMGTKAQARLLRALQENEITRVGESKPRSIDVRLIAATNANLEEMIEEGQFRKDLYYRLNVFPVEMPTLRELKSDIPLFVDHIVNMYAHEFGRGKISVSSSVYDKLTAYDWPGNVRELQNVISRAFINMGRDDTLIKVEHLMMPFIPIRSNEKTIETEGLTTLKQMHSQWEAEIIKRALKINNNNKTKTAKSLDISIRSLYNKLKEYKIG